MPVSSVTAVYETLFAGGKPKNLPVIASAGSEVMSRCTLFRNVSSFLPIHYTRSLYYNSFINMLAVCYVHLLCSISERYLGVSKRQKHL